MYCVFLSPSVNKVPTKPNNEGNKEPTENEDNDRDEKKTDEPKKPVPSSSETNMEDDLVAVKYVGAYSAPDHVIANSSSAANVSDVKNIKSIGDKSQSEEVASSPTKRSIGILDKLKQDITGGSDVDEKVVTKDNGGAQQPPEKSSVSDKNSQQGNEDEANNERNNQEENEKKVMDNGQGQITPTSSEEKDMKGKDKNERVRDQEDENGEENENVGNEDDESDKDVDDPQKDEGEETENKQQPLSRDNLQKKMMNPPDSFKDMRGLPRDAMSNVSTASTVFS